MQHTRDADLHPPTLHVSCASCALAEVCLPIAVSHDELEVLDQIIERRKAHPRGEYIYRAGARFIALFAVRTGAVKSLRGTQDGEEQIVGFHLPGEIFGLDGIGNDRYETSAVALESTAVCQIPFARMTELRLVLPSLNTHLLKLMSEELAEDQRLHILLSKRTAEERIATVLVRLSSRFLRRHLSPTRFRLPMSRADLGNYLGLVTETVSRVLTRLQRQGVIRVDLREIEILDLPRLYEVAGIPSSAQSACNVAHPRVLTA